MYQLSKTERRQVLRTAADQILKPWKAERTARQRRPKAEPGTNSAVYVIGPHYGGPVKVGITTDVTRRLRTLQTGHPKKLTIYAKTWVPTELAPQIERECHSRLSAYRAQGEWFRLRASDAAAVVKGIAAELVSQR